MCDTILFSLLLFYFIFFLFPLPRVLEDEGTFSWLGGGRGLGTGD